MYKSMARQIQKRTTWFTISRIHGANGWSRKHDIKNRNIGGKLDHWTTCQERIVGVDGPGDGIERVHVAWDADQVSSNVSDDGQHGSAAMAEFGFAEEWDEGRVGFGEFQLKMEKNVVYGC